jgi:hypothetical protein
MTPIALTEAITIPVSPEIAQTYHGLDGIDRDRLQAQITLFLQSRKLTHQEALDQLRQTMDAIGAEAARNGLTPEILESILNDPE